MDDEVKRIKKEIKSWEVEFTKVNGRKPGKEDINSKHEIKELYRKYIDLKKNTSHVTKDTVTCVAKDTVPRVAKDTVPHVNKDTVPHVTKDTVAHVTNDTVPHVTKDTVPHVNKDTVPHVTKDTVAHVTKDTVPHVTKDTVPHVTKDTVAHVTKDTVTHDNKESVTKDLNEVEVKKSPNTPVVESEQKDVNANCLSAVKNGDPGDQSCDKTISKKTAKSSSGEATSEVDVWGSDLNRSATSGGVTKEKKVTKPTKGSLFDKIGQKMLNKVMQNQKYNMTKSLSVTNKAKPGWKAGTERRTSTDAPPVKSSDTLPGHNRTQVNPKETPGKLRMFEKALKLSNTKTKPFIGTPNVNSEDITSPMTMTSLKKNLKSYSKIPSQILEESFDDIDGSWQSKPATVSSEVKLRKSDTVETEPLENFENVQDKTSPTSVVTGTSSPPPQILNLPKESTHNQSDTDNLGKVTYQSEEIGSTKERFVVPTLKPLVDNNIKPSTSLLTAGNIVTPRKRKLDVPESPTLKPLKDVSLLSAGNVHVPGKRKNDITESTPNKRRKKSMSAESLPDVVWDNQTSAIDPYKSDWNKGEESEDSEGGKEEVKVPVKKTKKSAFSARNPSTINDNFVMLNMKVKRYRRKGQQVTGPAYKRRMWKQKMKARSESYGSDKCFKCGETGHWANKCTGRKNKASSTFTPDTPELPQGQETVETPAPPQGPILDPEEVLNPQNIVRPELRQQYTPPPPIAPIYQPHPDGSVQNTPKEVYQFLKKIGHDSFRAGQENAVMRILSGLSTLLILSTGAGKSLCYQLPAYIYGQKQKCITLVISPLVSLMEDQVSGLPPGIKGACLHTNMTKQQREKIVANLTEGKLHFLLVSPEALVGGGGNSGVLNPAKLPPIAFACIDEVHCVSEWSHHFRPSYLRVCHVLKERLGVRCILGLTATATLTTAASVAQHLGIDDYKTATIRGTTVPDNLYPSVSIDEDRPKALIELLQDDRFTKCYSIIVYCTRRDQTTQLATMIRTQLGDKTKPKQKGKRRFKKSQMEDLDHWDAESYHAGLTPSQRKAVQNAFMSGRLRVVVATVAFGMGLDKSDVRAVIHYNMPKTFESYVQEIGRAGRDGEPAQCHVFLHPSDMHELKRHTYSNTIDRHIIKRLVRKLFTKCLCDVEKHFHEGSKENEPGERLCPGHERVLPIQQTVQELDIKEEGIATLLCYLELHPKRWVENLQPVYATCSLECYGGPAQFREIAKKCRPLSAAIALDMQHGIDHSKSRAITFPIVTVSDRMAWDSRLVKREVSNLQWNLNLGGAVPSKSGVMVEFSDLAFHFTSHGDLTDDEVDEVVDFLNDRIQAQEKTEIKQIHFFYETLKSVSHKHYYQCSGALDKKKSDTLKIKLREYFDSQPGLDLENVGKLTFIREDGTGPEEMATCDNELQVCLDIRSFIHTYSHDHSLNGRTIARIFHGIGSPNFPPEVWGKVRKFWRSHLHVDFNFLRTMATKELIRMK